MQRDILFRGKRKDTGDWVYGGYFNCTEEEGLFHYIFTDGYNGAQRVNPETVGQLSGLAEKDGKDVYEGDIVKFHYFFQSLGANLGVQESEHELIGIIVWGKFGWSVEAIRGQHWEGYTGCQRGEGECSIMELYSMNQSSIHEESLFVIGNIHDVNPASGITGVNHMVYDPNVKSEEEVKAPVTETEQEQVPGEATEETE